MTKIIKKLLQFDRYYLILIIFSVVVFASMLKINFFRYNNFDMGKFDLGNMTQMSWYSLKGKFMYLTDYFGSNVPRWSMSHIDPILVLFIPFFFLVPEPLTLVVLQNLLIILGSFFIYKIALLKTSNKLFSLLISLAYLSYPALGFVISWTGYHGVSPAIFFFLWFFYLFEKYRSSDTVLTYKNYFYLILLLITTLSGKEQISLYFIVLGAYIFLTSKYKKFGLFVSLFSLIWFVICFFVIIPAYAPVRVQSFERFMVDLGLSKEDIPNVYSSNYFLSRYSEFGSSYSEIIKNMVFDPIKTASIFISGDKLDNLNLTFGPLLYLPFLFPVILLVAFPDLLINYSTTQGGIGTSEIYNHRVSMIIPVLFISTIYGIAFLSKFLKHFLQEKYSKVAISLIGLVLFLSNIYFSMYVGEKNPVFSWIVEAVNKRVFAKSDPSLAVKNLKVGEVTRVNPLDENDRDCVKKIIQQIPPLVSVSGPDFMGSHLAQRETYAIYPAGKNTSDYLIIDIYSKKLLRILELDYSLSKDFISDTFASSDYELNFACGNLMVLSRKHSQSTQNEPNKLAPFQRYSTYPVKFNYEIYNKLTVVDYEFNKEVTSNQKMDLRYVYQRNGSKSLNDFVLFTTLVNKSNGEIFQVVNYPAFVFSELETFKQDKFYEEKFDIVIPPYLEKGTYMVFVGMDNKINTRSLYLGDTELK